MFDPNFEESGTKLIKFLYLTSMSLIDWLIMEK